MTSILELNSDCSDSEDDCDFVPNEKELSEDSSADDSEVDEDAGPKHNRKNKEREEEKSADDVKPKLSEEEEKKRADDLFKKFLEDVEPDVRSPAQKTTDLPKSDEIQTQQPDTGKITISEEYEFAGEIVKVTKEVDSTSTSNTAAVIPTSTAARNGPFPRGTPKRPGGLSAIMGKISNKKPKISTLEKSLLDWKSFKKEEGIEEELKHHNIGKDGYLERQAFLQRTDLRQFELEKDVRIKRRK